MRSRCCAARGLERGPRLCEPSTDSRLRRSKPDPCARTFLPRQNDSSAERQGSAGQEWGDGCPSRSMFQIVSRPRLPPEVRPRSQRTVGLSLCIPRHCWRLTLPPCVTDPAGPECHWSNPHPGALRGAERYFSCLIYDNVICTEFPQLHIHINRSNYIVYVNVILSKQTRKSSVL